MKKITTFLAAYGLSTYFGFLAEAVYSTIERNELLAEEQPRCETLSRIKRQIPGDSIEFVPLEQYYEYFPEGSERDAERKRIEDLYCGNWNEVREAD